MKRTMERITVTLVIFALAAGCQPKQGGRAGGGETEPPPAVKPTGKAPAPAVKPGPDPEAKCGGFHEKQEARRRAKEATLMDPYRVAGQNAALMEFIAHVADLAVRKAFVELEEARVKVTGSMKIYRPDWSTSHEMHTIEMTRHSLVSYASCQAIADDDPGWCTALGEMSSEGLTTCTAMHLYYRVLARKVIAGKTGCKEAMSEATLPGETSPDDAVKACQAIVDQKPDACPFEKGTRVSALCRALAGRDGRGPCEEFASEHQERWVSCCQSFTWRFANAAGGIEDARLVPEVGALSGDSSGCERALVWNLFARLAPLFGVTGVEGKSTPPIAGEPRPEPCPYQIAWSPSKVPGR